MEDAITRRSFLVRAAALGIAATAGGIVLGGCRQAVGPTASPSATHGPTPGATPGVTPGGTPAPTPRPTFGGPPPVVDPTPTAVTYGPMLAAAELVAVSIPSDSLAALLAEVAADAAIPIGAGVVAGRRQARLSVTVDDQTNRSQAYGLEIAATEDGPIVTVRAGDEAGAYYGLVSLAQLIAADGPGIVVRTATIDDAPGFARRGAILDPAPQTGIATEASRTQLLDRVRLGVRHKLNFVMLPGRTPWPDLVRYCDDHHVELMVAWGYQDLLTTAPRQQLKDQLAAQLAAGARSISLNWDDIRTTDPEALAQRHAEVFLDLYTVLRARDPGVHVSAVLPPYGGIPGHGLVSSSAGDGERYLAVMKAELPEDVRVFWTGDAGVFSETVTVAGAQAYADAVGHELGLWDNDAIRFSRERRPCSGRAAGLGAVTPTYMGNLAGEANWSGTNGEFALLTTLFYTWNPASYDPATGAAVAERILASD